MAMPSIKIVTEVEPVNNYYKAEVSCSGAVCVQQIGIWVRAVQQHVVVHPPGLQQMHLLCGCKCDSF
jgi:hypothetical protein